MLATRALQALGVLGILTFVAAAFTPAPAFLARRLAVASRPARADAIVVLGAGVSREGLLNDDSLRRAMEGMLLHRSGMAPLLVLLGPSYDGTPPEADVRAHLARRLGIEPEAILAVEGAFTTREEAAKVAALLLPRNKRRILLVTDSQHLVRAVPLFERLGFAVAPVGADRRSNDPRHPEERLELARRVAQELLARAYHRLAGCL